MLSAWLTNDLLGSFIQRLCGQRRGDVRPAARVVDAGVLPRGRRPGPAARVPPRHPQQADLLRGGHRQRLPHRQAPTPQSTYPIHTPNFT